MKRPHDANEPFSRRDFLTTTGLGASVSGLIGIGATGIAAAQGVTGTTAEEKEVLQVNTNFYGALQDLSLDRMAAVWLQEDWVKCVHPGWNLLEGWNVVRESWREMFQNTESMRVTAAVQFVRVQGSTAWVCCTEDTSSSIGGRTASGSAQATNIFERRNGAWYVVNHHSSPLLIP